MKASWKEALKSELLMSPDTQLVSVQCQESVTPLCSRSANSSNHPAMFSETTCVQGLEESDPGSKR